MIKRLLKNQLKKTGMVRELEMKNENLQGQLNSLKNENNNLQDQLTILKNEIIEYHLKGLFIVSKVE